MLNRLILRKKGIMDEHTVRESHDAESISAEREPEQLTSTSTETSVAGKEAPEHADATSEETERENRDTGNAADTPVEEATDTKDRKRRKKRLPRIDAAERRLQGRRSTCKAIADIAPDMLKRVKLRIVAGYLESAKELKGMDDSGLAARIVSDAKIIADENRILASLGKIDPDVNRRNLKELIIYAILLQEETHSLEEGKLEEKVIEYEKNLVQSSKTLDFFDPKKHDQQRWHRYETYRIVLDAAWRNKDDVSEDEAGLLRVLRGHLNLSTQEHWLIGAYLKRFPKAKCELHTRDEIDDARKELQRESILWSYRDENNRNIDVVPVEIVRILREKVVELELQDKNYTRILQHDSVKLSDLRNILIAKDMDRYGNRPDLLRRIVASDIKPSEVLDELDRSKLSEMCRLVGLKSSGNKKDFIARLIAFYDDLSFEERVTQDEREEWYNNYELLAARSYSDLKAKKLINKDLEIEHQFEKATDFLFETKLKAKIDTSRKTSKADGKLVLDDRQVMLWDCKSVEKEVNLQDHLEDQFDSYLRKEREKGNTPLAFLVIGPKFTKSSVKLAYQYKARTNWDVALIEAHALKYLADQWSTAEGNKAFPIQLLNRTEIIDKDRAEFLLSLA